MECHKLQSKALNCSLIQVEIFTPKFETDGDENFTFKFLLSNLKAKLIKNFIHRHLLTHLFDKMKSSKEQELKFKLTMKNDLRQLDSANSDERFMFKILCLTFLTVQGNYLRKNVLNVSEK
ncbi:CLUMA_CG001365, isoform A [Clunio marinus]|uniref:CLUMA_CG001365, isoform A n=1 Tax=Clunio marinus TaxID=568069 RepID=A0A1J1HHQ5_9DIPT|nr:CLUMA_CG001365, isoform A [Clunio marinus]